jgi:hypothetical protein
MAMNDIGIDLGTATVLVYDTERGLLLKEPSVVAVDTRTGDIIHGRRGSPPYASGAPPTASAPRCRFPTASSPTSK